MMGKITVLIPVYNEVETLASVLGELDKVLSLYPSSEIVVVDDGSTDNSGSIAELFTPHLVRLPKNKGVGSATKSGFKYITARLPDTQYLIILLRF